MAARSQGGDDKACLARFQFSCTEGYTFLLPRHHLHTRNGLVAGMNNHRPAFFQSEKHLCFQYRLLADIDGNRQNGVQSPRSYAAAAQIPPNAELPFGEGKINAT